MFSRWKDDKQEAALDQFWDQLQGADGSRSPGAKERPAGAEAIAMVLAHDDAPTIDPIFSAILLKDLTNMHAQQYGFIPNPNGHGGLGGTSRFALVASPRPWTKENSARRGRPRMGLAAGLAVLVVLLAIGTLAILPEQPREPTAIPAAMVQESKGIDTNTLLDASFAPGQMRGVDEALVIYSQSLVAPHTTLGFTYLCEPDDLVTFLVTEGTMTVKTESAGAVLRAGAAQWETIPGGATTEIGAGDAWYFENRSMDDGTTIGNFADDDLRFIWVAVRGNNRSCSDGPPKGTTEEWVYIEPGSGYLDPSQPVRVVLQSVSIPTGAMVDETLGALALPTEEQAALGARQWIAVTTGTLTVTTTIDGEESPIVHQWQDGRVLTQDDVRSQDDRTITFSNTSAEPVELLVLDIAVGDPAAAGGIQVPMIASPVPTS